MSASGSFAASVAPSSAPSTWLGLEAARFEPILRYFKDEKVAAYNWGLVSGKTQTIYPWDSWSKRYTVEPAVWFHDIFRTDGTPYDPNEVRYIRSILGR